ncbi:MAG TPA: pur operon repressor [Firmicutes bacterium]|nr:pur operon repressor [Bacillota bacterium]
MADEKRAHRIARLTAEFCSNPGKLFTLSSFSEMFGAARSTLSEDISVIKEVFDGRDFGRIETLPGAAGGARLVPKVNPRAVQQMLAELCKELASPSRVLPGQFIYMSDIVFSPSWCHKLGAIFAAVFFDAAPGCVMTVETKGIPLALTTAWLLGLPLVVSRREGRASEGSSVNINYMSGSSRTIQTMSLPRRALQPGTRVLVIDDFLKGGGTVRGMMELCAEFGAQIVGAGVLVETEEPKSKLVQDYVSLLKFSGIDEQAQTSRIAVSDKLLARMQRMV